ncbi:hypothetical protein [Kineococcus terrestris]|uniref:hypothetical protein n=1 Tax=Kineococcus terrestris TaxID=2044856 RepID=UPI0034DB6D65
MSAASPSGGDAAHAPLLGRMAQEGETALAVLTVAGTAAALGGAGALAVSAQRLWLAQPQLLGGPAVASVPVASVGDVRARPVRFPRGAQRLEVVVDGRPLRFTTRAEPGAVDEFVRALEAARGR